MTHNVQGNNMINSKPVRNKRWEGSGMIWFKVVKRKNLTKKISISIQPVENELIHNWKKKIPRSGERPLQWKLQNIQETEDTRK
jgi:hypothetical protein